MSNLATAKKVTRVARAAGPPPYVATREEIQACDFIIHEHDDGTQTIDLLHIPFRPTESRNANWDMCSRVNRYDSESREEAPTFFGSALEVNEETIANLMVKIDINLLYQAISSRTGRLLAKPSQADEAAAAQVDVATGTPAPKPTETKAEEPEVKEDEVQKDEVKEDEVQKAVEEEKPATEPEAAPEAAPEAEPEKPVEEPPAKPQKAQKMSRSQRRAARR